MTGDVASCDLKGAKSGWQRWLVVLGNLLSWKKTYEKETTDRQPRRNRAAWCEVIEKAETQNKLRGVL